MIAFGRIRERFGKTAGVGEVDRCVSVFSGTSADSLEDKWLRWLKTDEASEYGPRWEMMPRETLTIAGLEKGQGTISGTNTCVYVHHKPGRYCVLAWIST